MTVKPSAGWGPLVLLPAVVVGVVPATWSRWAFMWLLATVIFFGCKWLTWRRTPAPSASLPRHLGYLLLWPGMDAVAFLRKSESPSPSVGDWLFATAKFGIGLVTLFGVARLIPLHFPYLVGWIGMVGLIFVLHFGSFHLLSCAWRAGGVAARPLMRWPIAAESVSEFWGRRWNTAFRDLTYRFLFRPLTPRLGARGAVLVGFAASGVVHDVVISLPAGGGYGGPTLFFLLQGIALLAERSGAGRRIGLGRGLVGWLFTMAVLLLPACLLFHFTFVVDVIVPFLQSLGAI